MRSSEPEAAGRKILYLITNDISARFLRGQLEYLIEHGFDVEVGTKLSEPPAEFDDGVVVHNVAYEREPSLWADLRALWSTIHLIHSVRPDVVNASTPKAGLLGMIAARICRVPKRVYVVRGLRFESLSGWRRTVFRWLERLSTTCANDVVYNSPSLRAVAEKERSVRRGRGKVLGAGSGNGIDVARFGDLPTRAGARAALGLEAGATVIGFVGRLTHDKGIVDLVHVCDHASAGTMLLIVGDFEDGDPVPWETRHRIESAEHIVHVPWVDDTRTVYRAMDVLAFPSYREGLPNVPLEAQLCGVPVVAYAATGTLDAVFAGPPNQIVPVGERSSLAAALAAHPAPGPQPGEWVRANFRQDLIWEQLRRVYN